jgi:hypothetical protein
VLLLGAALLCRPVVLLLSLLALLPLLSSGLLLLPRGIILLLTLLLLLLAPGLLLLLFRGVVLLLSLLALLALLLLLLAPGLLLLLFRGAVLLLSLLALLALLLLLLAPGLLLLLFRGVFLLTLLLLPPGLLLLLFRGVVLSLTLLALLLLLASGLLLLLFRRVILLLALLLLLLSWRLSLLLLMLLLLLLRGLGLFVLLLLPCVGRSSEPDQQKNHSRTNDSNSFHGVISIESAHAPAIRPILRVNCQAYTCFDLSRAKSPLSARQPTWIREREWNNPNTLRSHNTTQMTTTAFKMDLILPAMGMKLFTSHRRTPTTIRAMRIWMRGMRFYLSVFVARHVYRARKEFPAGPCAASALGSYQFNQRLKQCSEQAMRVRCCSMSSALVWAVGNSLEKIGWPTRQFFYYKTMLDFAKTRVCALMDSFAVCLNNRRELEQTIQPRDLGHAPRLLGHGQVGSMCISQEV